MTRTIVLLIISIAASLNAFQSEKDTVSEYYYGTGKIFFEKAYYDSAVFFFELAAIQFENQNLWESYIDVQNHIIYSLRETGKDDSALQVARNTLEKAEVKLGKHSKGYARALNETGRIYNKKGKYDEAFKCVYESMELLKDNPISVQMSENYSLKGSIFRQTGEYDSALIFFNKALQIKKELYGEIHSSIGIIYNNIAYIFEEKGDYLNAREYYFKSLDALINTIGEDHWDIPKIYNNIAANYFYQGENELALEYYHKAVYSEKEFLEPEHLNFGFRYNNIAMALRINKEYNKAIEYAKNAIEIFRKRLGEEHPNYAAVINNLGRIYFDKEDYKNALESYQKAYLILKNKYGDKHPVIAQTANNIAEVYYKNNDFTNALFYSNTALDLRLEILGINHPKAADSYKLIGDIYLKRGDTDSALYFYQKAIITLEENFISDDVYINPAINKISRSREILHLISRKGNVFLTKYKKNSNQIDLRKSFESYALSSEIITKIRSGYKTENAKLSAEESAFNIYENGITAASHLYNITGNIFYLEKAFEFSEKSKAGILLDALNDSDAKKFSGIPDSLLEKEREIKVDLSYYDTQAEKEKEKGSIDSLKLVKLENSLFSIKRKYDELINYFENNYSDYYNLKFQTRTYSVNEIQSKLLKDNEILIEYFTGDSSLFIFLITRNDFVIKKIDSGNVNDKVRNFRNSLSNLDFESYAKTAYDLYSLLIKPYETELTGYKKLHIIPDGILNYLPFEALLTRQTKPGDIDFSELSYLLNDYEINYFYSASFFDVKWKPKNPQKSFVGIAPVFRDEEKTKNKTASVMDKSSEKVRVINIDGKIYSSLPESEKEVTEIFNLYNSKNIHSKVFTNEGAVESIMKSDEIKNYNVIHIASHGFLNENKPKLSGILFWVDDGDITEDGILYSGEIYNLNLNADLVVLSACESGLGKIVKGEGIIGLTRGFIYSGAKNVIVSLWQVADKSTSELMIEFYKNVLEGKKYSSALREAKLKLIRDRTYSYPLEWGPFVLIGK